jgi:hypothetical protein
MTDDARVIYPDWYMVPPYLAPRRPATWGGKGVGGMGLKLPEMRLSRQPIRI